ncbi:MAG: leucyl/phenylalanyl-tRNA--protein transferase [Geminicoccaceae bacterium]|nr:leucyl/phenylalanyl-tRNA--protein transferase [Geminicoccaceae bacterium]MCS7266930.1 leucyl/phenylalanyl-tRNA--protein transferase [Geminicoccaceae bacterium]MCX7628805.1 leucyl/phenylalanyl-tRNA--protein transferase [Geminicoccaceae bacterium]MDW8124146.1 leucyl/phenylalanyl-tRNA--protein transferase [Geminicoccaceae bacterium]MDW8342562.1 leucyl/phenylalanyl-tRNA--protein transferase [Geminicoccaceae bacterium]
MLVLTPHRLLRLYATGRFPMADGRHDPVIYLVDPERRGILPLDQFHVPRSLKKVIRKGVFEVRVDVDIPAVIEACAEPTPNRPSTWLNDELIALYSELAAMGHVHSVETFREGRRVGGLYGVVLGSAFFGESMFSRERDASKVALVELVARLRAGGFTLLDTQFVTDHLRRFGAIEIPRAAYLARLKAALARPAVFLKDPGSYAQRLIGGEAGAAGSGATGSRQSNNQTS